MGLFGKLFGSNNEGSAEGNVLTILAPVSGKVVSITEVPDPVFAEKLLGDGVAIEPTDGTVVAPITGTITALPDSLHAFTTKNDHALEVLVHVGLETVGMGGKGFETKTEVNAKINAGDHTITVDLETVKKEGNPTITPVVITSMNKVESIDSPAIGKIVKAGDPILQVTLAK